jgi:hypothetical protein
VIRACLRTAVDNRDFWTVFIEFWGEAFHERRLAAVNQQAYARARRLIGTGLAQGVSAGEFRRMNVEEAAVVVLAVLDGLSHVRLGAGMALPLSERAQLYGEYRVLRGRLDAGVGRELLQREPDTADFRAGFSIRLD